MDNSQTSLLKIYSFVGESKTFFNSLFERFETLYDSAVTTARSEMHRRGNVTFQAANHLTAKLMEKEENKLEIFNFLKRNKDKLPRSIKEEWKNYSTADQIDIEIWRVMLVRIINNMMMLSQMDLPNRLLQN